MTIGKALSTSLKAVQLRPEDQAARALAERYARDLDEAAVVSANLTKAMRDLLAIDPALHDRFLTLATRIEGTAVLAAIGPKLLAALEQLGMTPAARAAVTGKTGVGGGKSDGASRSKLDELRTRRERRGAGQHAPAPVD